MKVAIRADASAVIGTGHVMRCLTLAAVLRARGCEVLFVCRALEGHIAGRIESDGFAVEMIPAAMADDEAGDARETLAALARAGFSPDWIIVDHYGLGADWERTLRGAATRIMVIDDLADRAHDCDILLDQNLVAGYERRYDGLTPEHATRLLGSQFALLQPRYGQLHEKARRRTGAVKRILVYFGGADTAGLTELSLRAFLALERADLALDVIVAAANPQRKTLVDLAQGHANVTIHDMIPSLADLMAEADLAVGASGATSWERLCLGVPAIIVTLADNQTPIARELDRIGCVRWLGHVGQVDADALASSLAGNVAARGTEWFNADAASAVDGLGADRVADTLLSWRKPGLVLREATSDDVDLYFDWANDPGVRQQSFSQAEISREQHVAWFGAKLASGDCRMYVLCDDATPLGQIRFDMADGIAHIGYSLDAAARGRGLAKVLVGLGVERMAGNGARSFCAKVKHGNEASAVAFIRCGFIEASADGYRVFHRRLPATQQAQFHSPAQSVETTRSAR
jgi:UDP-2,4-diacetamido-2,4,6-trideoxy-beta-L-altropyranose hydrolase